MFGRIGSLELGSSADFSAPIGPMALFRIIPFPLLISCYNFFSTQLDTGMQIARAGIVKFKLPEDGGRGSWGEDDSSCRTGSAWTCIIALPILNS